jgi:hypothetical protein
MKNKKEYFVLFSNYNVDYTYCFQNKHPKDKVGILDGPHVRGEGVFLSPHKPARQSNLNF